jgi:hypothetical protein
MATYQSFIGDLNKFAKELGGNGMAVAVGVEAKKIAAAQVVSDIGHPRFPNWAAPFTTGFSVVSATAIVHKPNKKSAGAWTVAEKGRNSPKNGKTRGFGTATKATAKIEAMVPKMVDAELTKIVSKTLGG